MKKPRCTFRRKRGAPRRPRRTGAAMTLPLMALSLAGTAQAGPPAPDQLPTGGNVTAGAASIAQSNATMTITQSTNRAIINWGTFNVGANATVDFNQPGAGSVTLNRVTDPNPSQIFGHIHANGQIFLTNPSGVYFAPGARVDVGGLVATTHSIGDADFMAGNYIFDRAGSSGSVVNQGHLKASLGGYIALLAPRVRNDGVIVAKMGTVALAAGETYTLNFAGSNTLADVQVTPATIRALVSNRNAVRAPGGLILMSAQAANKLKGSVVNTGRLEASGLVNNGGVIRLRASGSIRDSGRISANAARHSNGNGGSISLIADPSTKGSFVRINGSISARGGALGGNGGFVETSGGRVHIGSNTRVDTRAPKGKAGQWLIDPDGFTIAPSGGDMTGAVLSANLAIGDVTIASTSGSGSGGNVNVNDAVIWRANKLTLTATNDVDINAVMTAIGTASLDLEPGSGKVNVGFNRDGTFMGRVDFFQADGVTPRSGTGFLTINNIGYTVITDLGAGPTSTTATDLQGINGDLAGHYALGANIDASATAGWASGAGFMPLGSNVSSYFSGIFDGLGHTVDGLVINRPSTTSVGMFGYGKGATVRNVGVAGGSISGGDQTGALLGRASALTQGVAVSNVYSTAQVTGGGSTGGLVGSLSGSSLTNSYASGAVQGGNSVGGLIGQASLSQVGSVFASGAVSGGSYVGGLIGQLSGGTVSDVFAIGAVTATGSAVGGLVGVNSGASISRGLAANQVNATGSLVGALIGANSSGTVANSFYDSGLAGGPTGFGDGTPDASGVVVGQTTAQLHDIATYQAAGWNVSLDTSPGSAYPALGFTIFGSTTIWVIPYPPPYVGTPPPPPPPPPVSVVTTTAPPVPPPPTLPVLTAPAVPSTSAPLTVQWNDRGCSGGLQLGRASSSGAAGAGATRWRLSCGAEKHPHRGHGGADGADGGGGRDGPG